MELNELDMVGLRQNMQIKRLSFNQDSGAGSRARLVFWYWNRIRRWNGNFAI